jgi:hypothetical protein
VILLEDQLLVLLVLLMSFVGSISGLVDFWGHVSGQRVSCSLSVVAYIATDQLVLA